MGISLSLLRPVEDFSDSFPEVVVAVNAVPILRLVQQHNGSVNRSFSQPEVLS